MGYSLFGKRKRGEVEGLKEGKRKVERRRSESR